MPATTDDTIRTCACGSTIALPQSQSKNKWPWCRQAHFTQDLRTQHLRYSCCFCYLTRTQRLAPHPGASGMNGLALSPDAHEATDVQVMILRRQVQQLQVHEQGRDGRAALAHLPPAAEEAHLRAHTPCWAFSFGRGTESASCAKATHEQEAENRRRDPN